jgi:hypothetical protein
MRLTPSATPYHSPLTWFLYGCSSRPSVIHRLYDGVRGLRISNASLRTRKYFYERREVVWTVPCREDCEGDDIEVGSSRHDFVTIDGRDAVSRIPKRTAAECAENDMPHLVIAKRFQLGRYSPPSVTRVENGAVTKVLSRCPKLEERKHLVV